ncbi:hypothetical protein GcM1_138006 [Golovinomyces cichoracearum]|uniref:Uncharacterized protein n=1 Tax=Golovinomyces cichoracearum TaxID=62708 RepID=A0A420JBT6_9PEZI|nr:hypothetical protein GcM1_138006 [Golovinomyces cichoracearum]
MPSTQTSVSNIEKVQPKLSPPASMPKIVSQQILEETMDIDDFNDSSRGRFINKINLSKLTSLFSPQWNSQDRLSKAPRLETQIPNPKSQKTLQSSSHI